MQIELRNLNEVSEAEWIDFMNDPLVREHLTGDEFTESDCRQFLAAKTAHWSDHGYGVWTVFLDDLFVGWAGLQNWRDEDVELAIVLCQRAWGIGGELFRKFKHVAFSELHLESIIVLLRHSRTKSRALERLGFSFDGEDTFQEERFLRYRLEAMNRVEGR